MQLISKFNKVICILLCVIDIFSKYAWVIPLNDKRGITTTNAFQKILDESNRKPNKIWVDKSSEFYNRSVKSWLEKDAISMYSTHNEGKSVVAERFSRTLKSKICKYMTRNTYINFGSQEINDKDLKFEIGDIVRISKYKNIFGKDHVLNWYEKVFGMKKFKNTVSYT